MIDSKKLEALGLRIDGVCQMCEWYSETPEARHDPNYDCKAEALAELVEAVRKIEPLVEGRGHGSIKAQVISGSGEAFWDGIFDLMVAFADLEDLEPTS